MLTVTENISMDTLKMECAGVAAGSKMLVGDSARALPAKRKTQQAILRMGKAERPAISLIDLVTGCLAGVREAISSRTYFHLPNAPSKPCSQGANPV
jgi:hypothetical protein